MRCVGDGVRTRSPPFRLVTRIKLGMKEPVLFDGRNLRSEEDDRARVHLRRLGVGSRLGKS